MKGYIVSASYRIIDDKPVVFLFGRLVNNESFLAKVRFKPYFAIREKDLKKAHDVLDFEHEETNQKNFSGEKVVRINAQQPGRVPKMRSSLEDAGITTYEADIRFVQRYYIDNNILGTIDITGEYEKDEKIERIYENPSILPIKPYDVKLKTLAIDIETDKDIKQIYSCSLYGDGVEEVHIVTDHKVEKAILYTSELELLKGIINRINQIDPDILTGWNVVDFDLSVIEKRLKHYELPFTIGRTDDALRVRIQHDFFRTSSASVQGRIVFDGIALLKQAYLTYPDFKLDTVAKEVLGERKIALEPDFWEKFPEIVKNEPERVVKYNLKDSVLVIKLLEKLNLINLNITKSIITGMQLDRVKGSVASLDSLYIRQSSRAGYVCPNSSFNDRTERIKGAYVMMPTPGIYDYVGVLDFKSLYPSIIRTYNIDPISHDKNGKIIAPNGARFVNGQGILPNIIETLAGERERAKLEKDDIKSYAIKIIMNSFYGVLANPSCRFYSLEMGNAITSYARETIKETAKLIEGKGYRVLYGDTDSVFVELGIDNTEKARQVGTEISKYINRHFSEKVKQLYGRQSFLELEFEKIFKILMLPQMRGAEAGAKKRYAGLLIKDGREEISVTGMEIVRRDWTSIAKTIQKELLERVFHKKEVAGYIKRIVKEIKAGQHDDELIYRKSIRKNLSEYVKTTPPHVKAARLLPKIDGSTIEYLITVNGPEPLQMKKSRIDYDHYIDKQVKPIADSILSLFGKTFDDVLENSSQSKLFDY